MSEAADTPEQAEFRAEVRAFLEAHAPRKRPTGPWAVAFHTDEAAQTRAFERGRAWQRTLAEHRLAGLTYPVEYGGRGGSNWHEVIYRAEAAAYAASAGYLSSTMAMLGPTLLKWGTEEQKRTLLPRLLSAEDAYCQLFSEPGAGSDLAGLATRATVDGDTLVVNGQKVWNSAAQFCTHGMLLVRTDPDAPKHRGITFVLVDMSLPGIETRPLVQANGAHEFNEVFFTDVHVPTSAVLGAIDDGWSVARTVMSNEAAFIGSGGVGIPVDQRLRALAERFGRTDDPVVRQGLVTAHLRGRILALMSERLQAAIRRREPLPFDPGMLKLLATANREHSGALATAIAGPHGVAAPEGDEIARWVQVEALNRFTFSIGGGTSEVQRNNLAERALGLPREPGGTHELPWRAIPRNA